MSVSKCILAYFRKHPSTLFFCVLIVLLVTLLSLLPPQLLRIIVDEIIPSQDDDKLMMFAFIYMLSFFAIGLFDFLKEIILVVISQGISKKIRLEMLSKIKRMSYSVFTSHDSGSLEAYFSNDVEEINTLVTSGVISMITDLFKIVGIIVSIFVFSYLFGFITLALLPLIILFTLWVRKKMFSAQSSNRKLEGNVNQLVLESLDNAVTIKAFRIYDSVRKKYNEVLFSHFRTNQKVNNYDAFFSPVIQILKTSLIVFLIIVASIFNTDFGISVGFLVAFIDLIGSLFSPIENIGMELQTIQKSFAAINRLNEFFLLEEDENKNHVIASDKDMVLAFENVSFHYEGEEDTIHNFSYVLKDRDRLVLKGRSGSGKSTLFKLAYGLIKPTQGRVTLNGVDTYLLSDECKRKYFGIVYQNYFFSGGSIKEEITLLDSSISDERVYEVLNEVGLTRIRDIHVPLKESDYSTGELSLFNIARAIVLDSRILFLDEMNASLDDINARKVIEVIDTISKERIVLSISHYGELLSDSRVLLLKQI